MSSAHINVKRRHGSYSEVQVQISKNRAGDVIALDAVQARFSSRNGHYINRFNDQILFIQRGEIRRNSEQKQTLVLLMAPQDLQLKETKNE